MNIYLVQVVDAYGPNKFLPLAIAYQWLYAKNDNWTLKDTLIEKIIPADYVASMENPKLVAMSSYVWNWEYNQQLAKCIKQKFPECIVVVGGPQIHKRDPNFFDDYPMFDVAIHGEGERAFKELLARPIGDYNNIAHVQTATHMPKMAQRVKDISDIPSPILEGFYEPIMAKYPKIPCGRLRLKHCVDARIIVHFAILEIAIGTNLHCLTLIVLKQKLNGWARIALSM
jgi:hypothetical protein